MNVDNITIRDEQNEDRAVVFNVNAAAFERSDKAELVNRVRDAVSPIISLVADVDGDVVGHILFTPVTVRSDTDRWQAMALGPMAVLPVMQRCGIGSALVEEGVRGCEALNAPAVFVLGHPAFYARFGFEAASGIDCRCEWNVPDEVFMVKCLVERSVGSGFVQYHSAFNDVT